MTKIDAKPKTLEELLSQKYTIDYYQREYKWQTQQILELLEDLKERFLESYDVNHDRSQVAKYSHYFLGDIIISSRDDKKFIIDGQQRLTSLTLLLIFIHHKLKDKYPEDDSDINRLIASTKYSQKSFNIDVEERKQVMKSVYEGKVFHTENQTESVINIFERYSDIEENFSESLKQDTLLYFKDWLINNVDIVEITAYSDEDAYIIFETMNDRGLSLTPTEMLKGFLLSNIKTSENRINAEKYWRKTILDLLDLGKNEDSIFIKIWLRAKYAESVRGGGNKYTINKDYENISLNFYKWVRDEKDKIGLVKSSEYESFINEKMPCFANIYRKIRTSAEKWNPEMKYIYYNANNQFSLQYPIILSSLREQDSSQTINKKINLVSRYVDIFIISKIIKNKSIQEAANRYKIFHLLKDIRDLNLEKLLIILREDIMKIGNPLDGFMDFSLRSSNKRSVRHILARITHHIESQCSLNSSFDILVKTKKRGKKGIELYEIEHILANKYERHTEEFEQSTDFDNWRNHIGALLLLPKSFNKSFGNKSYEEKVEHYFGQNLLAKSLHKNCYQNNPEFRKYIEKNNLSFKPYSKFGKNEIKDRQYLYQAICREIWSLDQFDLM